MLDGGCNVNLCVGFSWSPPHSMKHSEPRIAEIPLVEVGTMLVIIVMG